MELPMNTQDTHTLHSLQTENNRLKEENHDLRQALARLRRAIRALNNLHHRLDSVTPQSDAVGLVRSLLAASLEAVDSADGSLQLLDEEKSQLVFVEVQGSSRDQLLSYRMPASQGISGWCISHRQAELVPDVNKDPRFSPLVDRITGFRTSSLICVPLLDGARILGAIEVVNTRTGAAFTQEDLDILVLVGSFVSAALVRAEGAQR
jgi:sigma-B regulation protein RsbU (phosphoserine phosphatase)